MNFKKSSMVSLLALAVAPLCTEAAPATATSALNACVKAFVQTYVPNNPVRVTRTRSAEVPRVLSLALPSKHTIELSARGVESGTVLAQARCIADKNGIVLILDAGTSAETVIARAD